MTSLESPASLNTPLFAGPLVRIGAFRAPVWHPRFHDSGRITEGHIFVFPRTSVWIQHEGQAAFVADPNVVTFYNRGQEYRRDKIADDGDRCEWFAVADAVVLEAVRTFAPSVEEGPERPFGMSHGPSDAATYARQRRLVQDLLGLPEHDPLFVEETVLELLEAVLAAAFGARSARSRRSAETERRHRELAEGAKSILDRGFREAMGLTDLCSMLHTTPGHLCRVFRSSTGTTLHQYRDQLRLRAALEALEDPRADLTQLALDLGYSSHSHFTERFRRAFGETPSAWRELIGRRRRAGANESNR